MQQFEAEVLGNRELAPGWRELALRWDPKAGRPLAGQFLTIRVSRGFDPLLRRPFAVASFDEGAAGGPVATILYQVRGKATDILADTATGARADVLGPLGKGFPSQAELEAAGETPVLLAGGVGLGPVLFLAREFLRQGGKPVFLGGFRTASAIPGADFPEAAILCTDDGSRGFRGTALDWLAANPPAGRPRLLACGPSAMLAAVARMARDRGWEASLSAEQWMACGVGACMGCALPAPGGKTFLRACADGPVFGRDEVDWEAEAARARAGQAKAGCGTGDCR